MSGNPEWHAPEETPLSSQGAFAKYGLGTEELDWDVDYVPDISSGHFTDENADAARRNFRKAAALSRAAEIQNFEEKMKKKKREIETLRKRLSHQSLSSFRKKHLRKLLNEKKFKRDCLKEQLFELKEAF